MSEKIKTVINNGVEIPNECDCIWCSGKMHRKGACYMGAGTNQFALWCENCGAVVIHAKNFYREISGFNIKFDLKNSK